jgi:hypothetical protein
MDKRHDGEARRHPPDALAQVGRSALVAAFFLLPLLQFGLVIGELPLEGLSLIGTVFSGKQP